MGPIARRAFLKVAGTAGLALATGCRARPSPAGDAARLPQAPAEIVVTPTGELYTQSYDAVPAVDPAQWSLTVDGLVQRPRTLGYAEVLAYPKRTALRTLECIGNPAGGALIGNPAWGGFDALELWSQVGILPQARRARFTAADGYQTSVELEWITRQGTLLVHEINGEALPERHGFPLRILMPGLYGQKMPKWLTRVEFIDEPSLGYWESRGWSDVAAVKTHSGIDRPVGLGLLPAAAVPVYGLAFAGLRRITRVEVRSDDGEWQAAELLQTDSPLVWTQWSYVWQATPGRHRLAVRAADESGFVQSSEASAPHAGAFPDGTDAIHEVVVAVGG